MEKSSLVCCSSGVFPGSLTCICLSPLHMAATVWFSLLSLTRLPSLGNISSLSLPSLYLQRLLLQMTLHFEAIDKPIPLWWVSFSPPRRPKNPGYTITAIDLFELPWKSMLSLSQTLKKYISTANSPPNLSPPGSRVSCYIRTLNLWNYFSKVHETEIIGTTVPD